MFRRGRHRLRIALAVLLCLLFQQVAIAAYACTQPDMTPVPVEMADDCVDLGMLVGEASTPICSEHCTPEVPLAPDGGTPHVPPLALSPQRFAEAALPTRADIALRHDVPVDRSDPPPRLRYCSLLI